MSNHRPHFPLAILIHNGELIVAAGQAHPELAPRLPANYVADTSTSLGKLQAYVTGQKNSHGELGNLTAAQRQSVDAIQKWMNLARKLAFAGQTVKLHEEFQVGVTGPYDLGSFLNRADIILASVQTAANLSALKLKGWTDADTTAFATARQQLGAANLSQQTGKGGAKDSTNTKNADAADLYERLLTIQNAADLQWPHDDPANAGMRDAFRLNVFPPTGGSGNSAASASAPAPAALPHA